MLTVVTGPPCSGKTTYVEAHRRPGDIVIDHDPICQAIGSREDHRHPDHVGQVAAAMRKAGIRSAIYRHREGHRVWIVQCEPTSNLIYPDAEIVELTADREELYRRAEQANRPFEWREVIDKYLDMAPFRSRDW